MATEALEHLRLSVPGKVILFGEHAAVYGRPALIAALGLRIWVEARRVEGRRVRLDLPALDYREEPTWGEILDYTEEKRRRWREYAADPSPESFAAVRGELTAHAAWIALGEAAESLDWTPENAPGLAVRLDSEIPIGSGFGSSAALAVGLIGAVLKVGGTPFEGAELRRELRRLSLNAERRQHGTPSGIDNATVISGGVVMAEKPPGEEDFLLSPIAAPAEIIGNFRLYHTGPPRETTGEVVAAVGALRDRQPAPVEAALDEIEAATHAFAVELARTHSLRAGPLPAIRRCQAALEVLGVVPGEIQTLVRQVEAEGGAAKISGAGSLTTALPEHGAGSLLVYHPQPDLIAEWGFLKALTPIEAPLGVEGIRRETLDD